MELNNEFFEKQHKEFDSMRILDTDLKELSKHQDKQLAQIAEMREKVIQLKTKMKQKRKLGR